MSASILPILLLFDIAIHWAQPPLNLFVRTYMQISLEINLFSGRNVRFAVAKLNKSSLGAIEYSIPFCSVYIGDVRHLSLRITFIYSIDW